LDLPDAVKVKGTWYVVGSELRVATGAEAKRLEKYVKRFKW